MFFAAKKTKELIDIIEPDQFQLLLKVERARADRDGPSFSLVLFEMNDVYTDKYINEFIKTLKTRIRIVDYIGWFDSRTIGVILFSTNTIGANKFILDVEKKTNSIFPLYSVFCYPDHWINNDDKPGIGSDSGKNSLPDKEGISVSRQILDKIAAFFRKPIPPWKRVIDITGSFLGLVVLSPLFALTALLIKLVSPGPVFYKQQRVGYMGKQFTFIKFRTMHMNNDASNHKAYLKDLINNGHPMEKLDNKKDPRIIPCGQILRKSCIDELPQLINVLRGEMSLIGPRPCIQYEANEYAVWHRQRLNILPGMTGLWQVSGKNSLSFKQMVRLDIAYGEKMSLWLDLKILFLTIPTILGLIFDKLNKKLSNYFAVPVQKESKAIIDFNQDNSVYNNGRDYGKERKQSV